MYCYFRSVQINFNEHKQQLSYKHTQCESIYWILTSHVLISMTISATKYDLSAECLQQQDLNLQFNAIL